MELGMSNHDWLAEIMKDMRQYVRDGGSTELNPALKRASEALVRDGDAYPTPRPTALHSKHVVAPKGTARKKIFDVH